MMNDFVSRRAVARGIVQADAYSDTSGDSYRKTEDILDMLYDLPSAQDELIRCKDCECYVDGETGLKKCSFLNIYPIEDWYCFWPNYRINKENK